MIGCIFRYGNEIVEVRVKGSEVFFRTSLHTSGFARIDDIKLGKAGCIKEHPDLELRDDWREETLKRFKEKLKNIKTENKRMDYIIEDLRKKGYVPIRKQREGFRPEKV